MQNKDELFVYILVIIKSLQIYTIALRCSWWSGFLCLFFLFLIYLLYWWWRQNDLQKSSWLVGRWVTGLQYEWVMTYLFMSLCMKSLYLYTVRSFEKRTGSITNKRRYFFSVYVSSNSTLNWDVEFCLSCHTYIIPSTLAHLYAPIGSNESQWVFMNLKIIFVLLRNQIKVETAIDCW